MGPVAEMLRSESGGELTLDEKCDGFSFQSASKSPKIAFTSAKAMFDMVELDGRLAEVNNGVKPQRVSLLVASHAPLVPADVEICLDQRMAYAPGGAAEIKRMAGEVYPHHPSNAAKKSKSYPQRPSKAAKKGKSLVAANELTPVFGSEIGYHISDKSTCHVASCVMSLEATLAFCGPTHDGRCSAPSPVAKWPLDGKVGAEEITMSKKVSYRKSLQCRDDGTWEWV